jgi:hypothetical protein
MGTRFYLLVAALLLITTGSADAKRKWVFVRHYVGPTCHCGVHACGTKWRENGRLHTCVSAGQHPGSKRKRAKRNR